jgi:hypothetical protein
MRDYWDSSAVLNALAARSVADRLDDGEHFTRSHAFVEVFSHLSGKGLPLRGGGRQRVTAEDAARMVASLAARMVVRDLSLAETVLALKDAQRFGVQGARIHDFIHARAARLCGADRILTRDLGFAAISDGLPSKWP